MKRIATVLLFAFSVCLPAQNQLTNPGFESGGLAGWSVASNAFAERSTPPRFVPRSGTHLASMFGPFNGFPSESTLDQRQPASFGEAWTLSGWARHFSGDALGGTAATGGNALYFRLEFIDVDGNVIRVGQTLALDGSFATNTWHAASTTVVAPLGTNTIRARIAFTQPGSAPGAAHVDDMSLTRAFSSVPRTGLASRIGSNGQLQIREVRPDGTQAPWSDYVLRGIDMGWTPAGFFPWGIRAPMTSPGLAPVLDELAQAGFNFLRFYYTPTQADDGATRGLLDLCWSMGFKVLFTLDASTFANPGTVSTVSAFANRFRDHPAFFALALGNEWNLNQSRASTLGIATEVQTLANALKAADPSRVTVSSLAISPDNDLFRTDGTNQARTTAIVQTASAVDFWGINLYRTATFHPFFHQWETTTNGKTAAIFEFGVDSWDWGSGQRDLARQASEHRRHHEEAERVAFGPRKRSWFAGFIHFAAVDEYWKNPNSNNDPGIQEPDGFFTTPTYAAPSNPSAGLRFFADWDGHRSEEHFGVLELPGLVRKPVFDTIADRHFARVSLETNRSISLVSCGFLGPLGFYDNGFIGLEYEGNAVLGLEGGGIARGITFFVFDPSTGGIREIRTFDTYNGGAPVNQAANWLNAQPNGTLVGAAVADTLARPGVQHANLLNALRNRLGASLPNGIPFRAGYAIIGFAGALAPLGQSQAVAGSPQRVTVSLAYDLDRDGTPDALDLDDDGDGVTDADEIANGSDPIAPAGSLLNVRLELDGARHLELTVEPGDAPGASLADLDFGSLRLEVLTPEPADVTPFLFSPVFAAAASPRGGAILRTTGPLPPTPGVRIAFRCLDRNGRLLVGNVSL